MVWSAAHPHVSKLQRMLWQSLSRHLLQSRLRRRPPPPHPLFSVHRSYWASSFMCCIPHWSHYKRFMNTEGPISVSHASTWMAFGRGRIFPHFRGFEFIFSSLFPFPCHFSFLPYTYSILTDHSLDFHLFLHWRSQWFPLFSNTSHHF